MKPKIIVLGVIAIFLLAILWKFLPVYDELLPHRWQTYTEPAGAFSLDLPDAPKVQQTKIPVEGGGSAILHMISVQPTKHTYYACTYVDKPITSNQTPEQALAAARDGSMAKNQGKVLSQKSVTVQGFPGLELQSRIRGNSLMDSRIVLVGKRVYLFMAIASRDRSREPKTIQRVFDSFRILSLKQ